MGCGPSQPEDLQAQNESKQNKKKDMMIKKLLLLGAGESGKSTIFKQCKCLYVDEFSAMDRLSYLNLIRQNIINNTRIFEDIIKDNPDRYSAPPNLFSFLDSHSDNDPFGSLCGMNIFFYNMNRNTNVIQEIWKDRHLFQIEDSCSYFFPQAIRYGSKTLATNDDIFRLRVRTTGISEMSFKYDNVQFLLVDVGGQRNERKKWIHCFSSVSAIIFVTSLNEIDTKLYEDQSVNRLDESLKLFGNYFRDMTIILFLNKSDLLEEKLHHVNMESLFPDFPFVENSFENAVTFLRAKFLACDEKKGRRQIFSHVTCATDTDCVRKVFESVKESVVMKILDGHGFLD